MTHSFHPQATKELEVAAEYYDRIDPSLGDRFIDEIERTLARIIRFPYSGSTLSPRTRRIRLSGFPYGIIYRVTSEGILVLAVMHLQRKPGYWRDRLR